MRRISDILHLHLRAHLRFTSVRTKRTSTGCSFSALAERFLLYRKVVMKRLLSYTVKKGMYFTEKYIPFIYAKT